MFVFPAVQQQQQQQASPLVSSHVTVENHTTVNLVTHVNSTQPAAPALPQPSPSHGGFSRAPALRHSMYSRLRGSPSPGLRAPLRLCTSQEKLLLDDGTDLDASQGATDHQPGSRERRANAVWYEYGCV